MAVPKKKKSKSFTKMRRSKWLLKIKRKQEILMTKGDMGLAYKKDVMDQISKGVINLF